MVSSQGLTINADPLNTERICRTSPPIRISESEMHLATAYGEGQSRIRDPSMRHRQERTQRPEGNKAVWREALQHVNVNALERHISRMLYSKDGTKLTTDARWYQRRIRPENNDLAASDSNGQCQSKNVNSPNCSSIGRTTSSKECSTDGVTLPIYQKDVKKIDEDKVCLKRGTTFEDRNWRPRSSVWRKPIGVVNHEETITKSQSSESIEMISKIAEKTCANKVSNETCHISSFEKKLDQHLDNKGSQINKSTSSSNYVDLSSLNSSRVPEEARISRSSIESTKVKKVETQSTLPIQDQTERGQLLNKRNEESFRWSSSNKPQECEGLRNDVLNKIRASSLLSPKNLEGSQTLVNKIQERISDAQGTPTTTFPGNKEKYMGKFEKVNPDSVYSEHSQMSLELRTRRRRQLSEYVGMWTDQKEEIDALRRELLKEDPVRYRSYRVMEKRRSMREIYEDFFPPRGGEWRASSLPARPVAGRLELHGKINDAKRREELLKSVFGDGPGRVSSTSFATIGCLSHQRREKSRSNFNSNQSRGFSMDIKSNSDFDLKGSLKYLIDFKTRLLEK